ncbi:MAG: hypothetical protein ACO307_13870, partial [Ilumatobacteraceae bacterium]
TMDAISGFAPCTGSVTLTGTTLDRLPTHRRVKAGLGRTFQGCPSSSRRAEPGVGIEPTTT